MIASGSGDDAIKVFKEQKSVAGNPITFDLEYQHAKAHSGDVNSVRWGRGANSSILASAGDDGVVRLWKLH